MKTELKFMQQIAVSDASEGNALINLSKDHSNYYYLFTGKDGRIHVRYVNKVSGDDDSCWFKYAVPVPEKKKNSLYI